jgi:replicative DNA helicase
MDGDVTMSWQVAKPINLHQLIEDAEALQHKSNIIRGMRIIINLVHTNQRSMQEMIFNAITDEALLINQSYRMVYRMALRLREKHRQANKMAVIDFVSIYEEYKLRFEKNLKQLPDMDTPDTILDFFLRTGDYALWQSMAIAEIEITAYLDYIIHVGMSAIADQKSALIKTVGLEEAERIEREALKEISAIKPKRAPTMADTVQDTLLSIRNFDAGISTGLNDLDRITRLNRGCLYIIAGRPAMGKTAVALHLAQLDHGKKTLFISLEMPKEQLTKRLISSIGGIDHHLLTNGLQGATEQDFDKLASAVDKVGKLNLQIFDDGSLSIDQLLNRCSQMRESTDIGYLIPQYEALKPKVQHLIDEHGYTHENIRDGESRFIMQSDEQSADVKAENAIRSDILHFTSLEREINRANREKIGLIIVDYLQLMTANKDFREQEIATISRGLKQLAKMMDCPVIALAQINRGVEGRPNKRPTLSDLRESGSIEQDADAVLMLYRDEVYHPDTSERDIMEIGVTKNRHGEIGVAKVIFDKQKQRLKDTYFR